MNITIAAVPVSIFLLVVAFFLWKQAKSAQSKLSKFELYTLSIGVVIFLVVGWVAGVWLPKS